MTLAQKVIKEFHGSNATFYKALNGEDCVEVVDTLGIHKRHNTLEYAKQILTYKRMMNRL